MTLCSWHTGISQIRSISQDMARQMVTGCVQKNIPILPLYLGYFAGARASRDVMFISAWNCTSSVLLIWAMREPQCVGRLAGKFSTLFSVYCNWLIIENLIILCLLESGHSDMPHSWHGINLCRLNYVLLFMVSCMLLTLTRRCILRQTIIILIYIIHQVRILWYLSGFQKWKTLYMKNSSFVSDL